VTSVHVKHAVEQLDRAVVRVDDAPAVIQTGHVITDGDEQRGRVRNKQRNAARHKRAQLLHHACRSGACSRCGRCIFAAFHLARPGRSAKLEQYLDEAALQVANNCSACSP
jgi:hypothetical protein